MLQCHPYPSEYVDPSKPCPNSAFFMGLRMKEKITGQEPQQFDIRRTVDNFREEIGMYLFWKPGMDIYVSHVRRRHLPSFVFSDGQKRSQLLRHLNEQGGKTCEGMKVYQSASSGRHLKRKKEREMEGVKPYKREKRASISPERPLPVFPGSSTCKSGGTSQIGFCEGVCYVEIGDANNNSEVRSSGGHWESEKDNTVGHMPLAGIVDHDPINLNEQNAMCVYNLSVVSNETESSEMVEPSSKRGSLAPCEVPNGEAAGQGSALIEGVGTVTSERLLNGQGDGIKVDQELAKPCNQVAVVEVTERVFESNTGIQNLNCKVSFSV